MNIIDLLVYICVGIIIIKYSYIAFSCYDFIFKIPVLVFFFQAEDGIRDSET